MHSNMKFSRTAQKFTHWRWVK